MKAIESVARRSACVTQYYLEYHPQKILHWLRSYNIPFRVFQKSKDFKELYSETIRERKYFTMSIENYLDEIEFDSVNECIFVTFLMWNGKNLEMRNNFLQLIQENAEK